MIFTMTWLIAPLLFLGPPVWMASKGWPIRAGLTMLLAAILPTAVMVAETDDLPPGAGFVIFVAIPFVLIALLTIIGGIVAAVVRAIQRARSIAPDLENTVRLR
jgi:hypothetical protein